MASLAVEQSGVDKQLLALLLQWSSAPNYPWLQWRSEAHAVVKSPPDLEDKMHLYKYYSLQLEPIVQIHFHFQKHLIMNNSHYFTAKN